MWRRSGVAPAKSDTVKPRAVIATIQGEWDMSHLRSRVWS